MKLPGMDRLGSIGYVGERKAVALLCMGFFATLFFMISLQARTELPEFFAMFSAMTLLYLTAFFGVAAEWFWGRWFATGLGYWGVTMTIMTIVTTRSAPTQIIVFGVMHGLMSVLLQGEKMAALFDAKPEWRERWKLDEQGVVRVRKSVTRAASSLPALILFALAPRQDQSLYGLPTFDAISLTLAAVALFALVSLLTTRRTWAVMLLGASGVGLVLRAVLADARLYASGVYFEPATVPHADCMLLLLGAVGGLLLVSASVPFVGPMLSYLVRGRR
jgi:hypothetical protein